MAKHAIPAVAAAVRACLPAGSLLGRCCVVLASTRRDESSQHPSFRAEAASSSEGARLRVLVADDTRVNRMLMRRNLELELDVEVTEAASGEAVLELVLHQHERFDAGEHIPPSLKSRR